MANNVASNVSQINTQIHLTHTEKQRKKNGAINKEHMRIIFTDGVVDDDNDHEHAKCCTISLFYRAMAKCAA